MRVLVVGEGGREHALIWALSQSPSIGAMFAAPGNAGMAQMAECIPIGSEDGESLAAFAVEQQIDLAVIGPDGALAVGVVDQMHKRGIRSFGPTQAAARIEYSKAFAKQLMIEEGVPTAAYRDFLDIDEAKSYVRDQGAPIVVKADGLAAGKGVAVCHTVEEAIAAVEERMLDGVFGEAGDSVVIEEYMEGEEASVFTFTDGESLRTLVSTQDHKQIYEGDVGPNTGGMGAYAPAPLVDHVLLQEVDRTVVEPTIRALAARGCPYQGVLYTGLMINENGHKVVEFNSRFGDPETQVLLPLLKNDLLEVILAVCDGSLSDIRLDWHSKAATCVVLASEGYPGAYEKGKIITGLDGLQQMDDIIPFHANTAFRDGHLVTNGGRVVGVTAMASDLPSSIDRAYEAVESVSFEGKYYRKDIGKKALKDMV